MAQQSDFHLAPYAVRSSDHHGRTHYEADDPMHGPFELDRHRIIECTAFRRLEGKTQVFAPSHHDHFRTRLTHTLEVALIARCLAVKLRANESLAEAIALAHDLGHPPFGHAGEATLNEAMVAHGGFNHNTHSLRVVEHLEHPFPAFRGLNLTAQTRAGLLTHVTRYDTPISAQDGSRMPEVSESGRTVSCEEPERKPQVAGSVEAQIASVADRITYGCHDLEDAIGASFIGLGELRDVALWASAYERTVAESHSASIHAIRRGVLDAILHILLADVIETSRSRLEPIGSPEAAQIATRSLIAPSAAIDRQLSELERFLMERVYRHTEVATMDAEGRRMVLALLDAYRGNPNAMPSRFVARIDGQGLDRVICDYIAGMTDRFCRAEWRKLVAP